MSVMVFLITLAVGYISMPNLSLMIMNIMQEHINTQFITNDCENYPTNDGPPPLPSPLWVMMTNKGAPSFLYIQENVSIFSSIRQARVEEEFSCVQTALWETGITCLHSLGEQEPKNIRKGK